MGSSHGTSKYRIVGEQLAEITGNKVVFRNPTSEEDVTSFRFCRMGPRGPGQDEIRINLLVKLALAMVDKTSANVDGHIPAGYTYLGQFVDHDFVLTPGALTPDLPVDLATLNSLRSPLLDLDCLYGLGPDHPNSAHCYQADLIHLKIGHTEGPKIEGFDLPRSGVGATKREQRQAAIADPRNDENLAVAQIHNAMIRFHNRVVDEEVPPGLPRVERFQKAREIVTKHYQWMLRHDYLPRLIDPAMLNELWTRRRFFEPQPTDFPAMPIEFSVAAFRLGHSMIREAYEWNKNFGSAGAFGDAHLFRLFRFSGGSGNMTPQPQGSTFAPGSDEDIAELRNPDSGSFLVLPHVWITDWRGMVQFEAANLQPPPGKANMAKRIDTLLEDPLKALPQGSFSDDMSSVPDNVMIPNLAFRNLARGRMLALATGQQMATMFGVQALSEQFIIDGSSGADLSHMTSDEKAVLGSQTPLWFYILREAEANKGRLGPVCVTIVAEVFHRGIEAAEFSILTTPEWRPTLGANGDFSFPDLLLYAFNNKLENLNPVGD